MRKKLDTRFPAARIKKIMQTDEDVGKIAMAVPLLVSKALELFLQDLCDRTYEITLNRGAKTMNSLHLKQCVHSFNVFDFLKDTVSKVPDLGCSDAAGEDRPPTKRRKVTEGEDHDSDEELKKSKVHDVDHSTGIVKRGRGRPRGRGRGSRMLGRDMARRYDKFEDDPDMLKHNDNDDHTVETLYDRAEPERPKENIPGDINSEAPVRNFDLNVDLNEIGDSTTSLAAAPDGSAAAPDSLAAAPDGSPAKAAIPEPKHEEYPGWSFAEIESMAIDPIQLANLNRRIDEEDEDYDEEG